MYCIDPKQWEIYQLPGLYYLTRAHLDAEAEHQK